MANGKFAAVFGNGYNSVNHVAVLYIVDIDTGALIKSISTEGVVLARRMAYQHLLP
jgi:type IV pilus assembly protein PilY1